MKKSTLVVAASAMLALSANAAYTVDPGMNTVIGDGNAPSVVYPVVLCQQAVAEFEKAGSTIIACGANGDNRNFWWWNEPAWSNGTTTYPGVDMQLEGYVSLDTTTAAQETGWSAGGFAVAAPGVDLSKFSDETRFHMAYRTEGVGPASMGVVIVDAGAPAKFCVGAESYDDSGAQLPNIGTAFTTDWTGIDISFADLKKIYPSFDYTKVEEKASIDAWTGNIVSIMTGAVAGRNVCLDAVYFYNPVSAAVEGVAAEGSDLVITAATANANGEIVVYNLAGAAVKSGFNTVGLDDLKGVYIIKAGNNVKKVVL